MVAIHGHVRRLIEEYYKTNVKDDEK